MLVQWFFFQGARCAHLSIPASGCVPLFSPSADPTPPKSPSPSVYRIRSIPSGASPWCCPFNKRIAKLKYLLVLAYFYAAIVSACQSVRSGELAVSRQDGCWSPFEWSGRCRLCRCMLRPHFCEQVPQLISQSIKLDLVQSLCCTWYTYFEPD